VTRLSPGAVVWADFGEPVGREQAGRRPAVVVSTTSHLRAADTLVTLIPCTTRERPWPNHVLLEGRTGLGEPTFAMTEQIRTLSRLRVHGTAGAVSDECLGVIGRWVRTWHLPAA
jgi:mRNA interferase MazF